MRRCKGQLCVNVLNFIKIGQSVADIWRFNGFFSKWRPSAILMITGGLYLEIHLKPELTYDIALRAQPMQRQGQGLRLGLVFGG